MSIERHMITEVLSLPKGVSVKEALEFLQKHDIRSAPIVDGEKFVGMFRFNRLLKAMLPVALTMEGALSNVSSIRDTGFSLAEKLSEILDKDVTEVIDMNAVTLNPENGILEGLLNLYQHGSPIAVVDKNKNLKGILSHQTTLAHLNKLIENK